MQKILIDANVILRYLLNDVEEMAKKSEDEIEHKKTVIQAVKIFSKTNLDFVDCILIAYKNIENAEVFSFDKKLNNKLK